MYVNVTSVPIYFSHPCTQHKNTHKKKEKIKQTAETQNIFAPFSTLYIQNYYQLLFKLNHIWQNQLVADTKYMPHIAYQLVNKGNLQHTQLLPKLYTLQTINIHTKQQQ